MLSPILSSLKADDPYEQLIAQMIRLERQPQYALQDRRDEQKRFKAVLSDVDSKISALHTLVKRFTAQVANPFAARAVTNGQTNAFRVSAGTRASLGTHTLDVQRLARADTRVSARYASDAADLRAFFDANGAQTFSIDVAHPTANSPQNRVAISVTVDPAGSTNAEIMSEIAAAVNTAMSDAAAAGTITQAEKAGVELLHETADTSRLSLRSGKTGYANRLGFTDSAGGLLAALQVNRAVVVAADNTSSTIAAAPARVTSTALTAPITIDDLTTPATAAAVNTASLAAPVTLSNEVIPPTAATFGGTALAAPVTINGANDQLQIAVNGATRTLNLTKKTYNTLDELRAEIQTRIGADVTVGLENDALRFSTVATGSASSLQVLDSEAVASLGLTVMGSPVTGTDQQIDPPTLDLVVDGATINATLAAGTYNTLADLAAAIQSSIGPAVDVSVENDTLRFASATTGSASSLQFTGGTALSTLGLAVMGNPAQGADEQTTTPTLDVAVDGTPINATIPKGTYNTLADLAAAIQGQLGPDVSVTAQNDALRFETTATGSAASLQIIGGSTLSQLGLSAMSLPVTGTDEQTISGAGGGMITDVGTGELDSGLNAVFDLNGLTHYRASNTVSDALTDVTIDLTQAGTGAAEFSVVSDKDGVRAGVEDFIKKYNDLQNYLRQKTSVDADAKTRGDLAGDSVFNDLRYGLRTDASRVVAGQPAGAPSLLSQLGLRVQKDGTLELTDADKLTAAVEADAGAVQNLFSGADGVATRLTNRLDRFLGLDGILSNRQNVIDDRVKRLDGQIKRWDDLMAIRENQLREQFARVQETIALFQGQQQTINSIFLSSLGYGF